MNDGTVIQNVKFFCEVSGRLTKLTAILTVNSEDRALVGVCFEDYLPGSPIYSTGQLRFVDAWHVMKYIARLSKLSEESLKDIETLVVEGGCIDKDGQVDRAWEDRLAGDFGDKGPGILAQIRREPRSWPSAGQLNTLLSSDEEEKLLLIVREAVGRQEIVDPEVIRLVNERSNRHVVAQAAQDRKGFFKRRQHL